MQKIIDGKYEIIAKIGSGGTSNVFKARRISDGRLLALKVLRDEFSDNEEQVERFLRESHALSHLSHENIVNIADVGKTGSSYYIAMEYIDGITLKEYLKVKKSLPFLEVIDAALQIAAGISHAHENNIIHRDIKPQNILVSTDGTLKVADFGIARVLNQNTLTMAGKDVVGSVHYISPEQARGTHIDARSDIYSLGVVMYELATGGLPYSGSEAITVAMKHVNQLPPKPMEKNTEIPKCLNDIILKCLAKDPSYRYQTVAELIKDLNGAAADPYNYTVINLASRAESALFLGGEKEQRQTAPKHAPSKQAIRKRTVILLSSVLGGVALLITVLVLIFSGSGLLNPTGTRTVPSVVGLEYDVAVHTLLEADLRATRSATVAYSATVPKGCVISQDPLPQAKVPARETVTLVVSAGQEMCVVPNLTGLTQEQAAQALQSVKLTLGTVREEASPGAVAGTVVRQSAPKESQLVAGSAVDIWLASAAGLKKKVPDLTGKTEQEAKDILIANGFVNTSVYQEASTAPVGTVVRQTPQPNEEYDVNTTVSVVIWLSLGVSQEYSGQITIDLPVVTAMATFRVVYFDGADEVEVYSEILTPGEELPALVITGTSSDPTPRTYISYLDNETYEQYVMDFYDDLGYLVTPAPSPGPTGGVG